MSIEEQLAALESRIQQCYIVTATVEEQAMHCVRRAEEAATRAELASRIAVEAGAVAEAGALVVAQEAEQIALVEEHLEDIAEEIVSAKEEEPGDIMEGEEQEHAETKEEATEVPLRPDNEGEEGDQSGVGRSNEPILIRVHAEPERKQPERRKHTHKNGFKRGRRG